MKKAPHSPLLLSPLLSLLMLASGAATAADDAAVLKCRALPDGAQRLACYDAMPVGAAPLAAALPLPAAPVAAAAPAQTTEQTFGIETLAKKTAALDAIESTVVGEFSGWTQGTLITLANGQVWRVIDGDAVLPSMRDPRVRISRGAFSAIYLQVVGENNLARVRRVK